MPETFDGQFGAVMKTSHIENRRLMGLALGRVRLGEKERQHFQDCKVCQGVLYVLLNQPNSVPPETSDSSNAA